MTANQRLMVALALSAIFFIGYSYFMPPQQLENNTTEAATASAAVKPQNVNASQNSEGVDVGHTIHSDEQQIAQVDKSNILAVIESPTFTLEIDTLGRIASKVLKEEKFYNADGQPAQLVSAYGAKPLYLRFSDAKLNELATKTPYTTTAKELSLNGKAEDKVSLTLTQKLDDLVITKALTFYGNGHYDVSISMSKDVKYFVYLGYRPKVADQMMVVNGAMIYNGDDQTTIFEDEDVESRHTFSDVHFASAFDQYFATLFYDVNTNLIFYVDGDSKGNPVVYFDGVKNNTFKGYIGPKDYRVLASVDPTLTNAIEYGWFTFVAAPLFSVLLWLDEYLGNWGWAIIVLTILIRILLYPLTYKGMVSMQKIKEVAPKVKEIQAKYKGDPQRMNAAVMELYKKHGANPLGGCLPLFMQIPVFFAIYRVLLNSVELQGAPWILWVTDLSRMDPTYVLPILMGASMYFQQRITPSNFTDPMQEKIFKFLPVIFTFFFVTFPAGLVLYWFVNNLLSIAQQYIVNKSFERKKQQMHEKHLAEKKHDKN